jgi:hypothetical protein
MGQEQARDGQARSLESGDGALPPASLEAQPAPTDDF